MNTGRSRQAVGTKISYLTILRAMTDIIGAEAPAAVDVCNNGGRVRPHSRN